MHEETALSVYVSDSHSNQLNQLYHMKSTLLSLIFTCQCRLPIIFANSLDQDQARLNVGPDLDPNFLTL